MKTSKSQRVLEKYIKRKYSGKALVSSVSTDIVNTSEDKFLQGEKVVGSTSSAFGYVTKIDPTNNQIVVNDTQGSFQQGETVTGIPQVDQEFHSQFGSNFKDSPHHYETSEGLKTSISTNNIPVSNNDYEQKFNDDKRNIKYIKIEYLNNILSEFKKFIREHNMSENILG